MIDPSPCPDPSPFQSLPECLICQFYNCDVHLRCAVHPSGATGNFCPDFAPFQTPQSVSQNSTGALSVEKSPVEKSRLF